MDLKDEKESIPYLQDQIKQYKIDQENMAEKYLHLKEKFEKMKHLEADLRHEILQLKKGEIEKLKEDILEIKALLKENSDKKKDKIQRNQHFSTQNKSPYSSAKQLQSVTFREIQDAKRVYKVAPKQTNAPRMKRNINQSVTNNEQSEKRKIAEPNLSGPLPNIGGEIPAINKEKSQPSFDNNNVSSPNKKPEKNKEIQAYTKENRSFIQSIWQRKK